MDPSNLDLNELEFPTSHLTDYLQSAFGRGSLGKITLGEFTRSLANLRKLAKRNINSNQPVNLNWVLNRSCRQTTPALD